MKTNNNTTDSTLINSAVILLAILFVMLSFQVKAQALVYGCLDTDADNYYVGADVHDPESCLWSGASSRGVKGYTNMAIIQATTPSRLFFDCDTFVVRYKQTNSNTWTELLLPMNGTNRKTTVDTLGVQYWHFYSLGVSSITSGSASDGDRDRAYVKLNNLNPFTSYDVEVSFRGTHNSTMPAFSSITETNILPLTFISQFMGVVGVYAYQ
jgi:hypothetical protein